MGNLGTIRGDGSQALGIGYIPPGVNSNWTLAILFAKTPSPCPVTPTPASTSQPTPGSLPSSAMPTGSQSSSSQTPTASSPQTPSLLPTSAPVQPPQGPSGSQPIIIAFAVLIPLLVGGVVVAIFVLKRKKKACFADKAGGTKKPDLALSDL